MLLRFEDTGDVDDPLYARYAHVTPGTAGRCPRCDGTGVVYSVERAAHVQNQHCPGCGCRWQYRFLPDGRIAEARDLAGDRLDLLAPSPEDLGDVLDLRDDRRPDEVRRAARWWRRSPV